MRFALISNKFLSGAALVAALLSFSGDALAQSGRELGNRLSRLENEVETLSRAIYRGENPPPAANFGGDAQAQANTEIRLQQLELQIRELTGKLEEQTYEVRQMKSEMERMSTDMNMRLSDLEGTGRGGVTTNSNRYSDDRSDLDTEPKLYNEQRSSSNTLGSLRQNIGRSGAVADDAAAAYENAFSLLKNGNYDGAEQGFETFLQNHKNHALAGNAKYWLGETFYVRGDFERAARIFAEGYQQYPTGSKMADNLLKLGLSLSSIGNTKDACVALRQLKKDSPPNSGPVLRRADQEMSRLGC